MTDAPDSPTLADAVALHQSDRVAEAAEAYRKLLRVRPDDPNALHLLGVTQLQLGDAAGAETLIAKAIARQANVGIYHLNHAVALRALRRIDDAIAEAEKAIALDPAVAARGYHVAGLAFHDDAQLDDAIFCFEKSVEIDPKLAEAQVVLGRTRREAGRFEQAVRGLRAAVAVLPDDAMLRYELGASLRKIRELADAVAELDEALRRDPKMTAALVEKGWILGEMGRLGDAASAFEAALEQRDDASAQVGLAATLMRLGELDRAVEHYREAVRLDPTDASSHSALLLTLHYLPSVSSQQLFDEHREWNRRHAEPLASSVVPHANDGDPDRPLRVGFVSADFCGHPVSRFMQPVLENSDRRNFTFVCYSATKTPDAATGRLRAAAGEWHDVVGLSDEQLAKKVREDRVDILVDLAGHTARNRLLVFARKPAPVQCTHFGYPDTTGVTTIDYRMTDALADPPGATEQFHSEQLARLPYVAWCYQAPPDVPAPNFRDAASPITFGSINNITKVTPPMLRLWQRVLDAVPGSRLLFLSGFNDTSLTAEHLRRHGLNVSRVDIVPPLPVRQYFELFHRIDVALDPFPYNGGVTTCDTLWMGVPLVTLAGDRYVSRQGLALLTQVGLTDLVAKSEDEYLRIAVGRANDPARRADLRATLRRTMSHSPICDGALFTRGLMDFYRDAWRSWCAGS